MLRYKVKTIKSKVKTVKASWSNKHITSYYGHSSKVLWGGLTYHKVSTSTTRWRRGKENSEKNKYLEMNATKSKASSITHRRSTLAKKHLKKNKLIFVLMLSYTQAFKHKTISTHKKTLISSNNNWCSTIFYNMLNFHKNIHSDPFCQLPLYR